MKIVLDAMGGDNAPRAIVEGAVMALESFPDIDIVLTGDPALIEPELREMGLGRDRVEIVPAMQVITMSEDPTRAPRLKKDSSLVKALMYVADKPDAMMISAGNTGALVAGSVLYVHRIKGIKRPALAPVLPTRTGAVLLIDGGANTDCKPIFLAQFALMGSIYMKKVFSIAEPRVALINNGEESEKGTALTKDAFKLISKMPVRFVGNVEGRDLLSGKYDVLVTDGFTGNVVLKFVEGCSKTILGMLKEYISESTAAKIGAVFMRGAFSRLKKKMDYEEYGGALLLGVRSGVMKAHGSSDSKAIAAAIGAARSFIRGNVVKEIGDEIAALEQAAAVKEAQKLQTASDDTAAKGGKTKAKDTAPKKNMKKSRPQAHDEHE